MNPQFPPLKIEISRRNALHLLGFRKKSAVPPPELESQVERELAVGRELLRFRGVYRKFSAKAEGGRIVLENGYTIESERFCQWIEGCRLVYLFAVTAGRLFTERTAELLNQEQVSRALIADAVGSAAAESCAEAANRYLAGLESPRRLTKRYSPGYGDWDVADNRSFLDCIKAEEIGITVNSGGLMQPEKSVSAAIGVYEENSAGKRFK